MSGYNDFLSYAAVEKSSVLKVLLFDVMAFYSMCNSAKDTAFLREENTYAIYTLGELLCDGSCYSAEEAICIAKDAMSASDKIVSEFKSGKVNHLDWNMEFPQYLLFNSICNTMQRTSITRALEDFERKFPRDVSQDEETEPER